MNRHNYLNTVAGLVGLLSAGQALAGIIIDTSPGTAAPPDTLGGYSMVPFSADPTAEGTMITSLTPPAGAAVTGDLTFSAAVEHDMVGSWWSTWSHGYTGDAYYNDGYKLNLSLPDGTLAFYLYIEPNLKADFEFDVTTESAVATSITINGNAGAKYVGVYSDDPMDSVTFVFVKNAAEDADGFAVGEFGINGVVPEPTTWSLVGGVGLGLFALARKVRG